MDQTGMFLLCLSLRGSERIVTQAGSKLDKLQNLEAYFQLLTQEIFSDDSIAQTILGIKNGLERHHATAIFAEQFRNVFSKATVLPVQDCVVDFQVDAVTGRYRLSEGICLLSPANFVNGIEGDDLIFVLMFKKAQQGIEANIKLHKRLTLPSQVAVFLGELAIVGKDIQPQVSNRLRAGFYAVPLNYKEEELAEMNSQPKEADQVVSAELTLCGGAGYFFYSWLICQRIERGLLLVNVNGDWEDENRRILFIKKQLVTARKLALMKHRAFPGSMLLNNFRQCLESFRLESQFSYLTVEAEEAGKVLDAQNAYIVSSRIRSIEIIILLSALFGLAVALNAIQMKPFYEAETQNALGRPIFWMVFATVIAGALLTWCLVKLRRWTRRFFPA